MAALIHCKLQATYFRPSLSANRLNFGLCLKQKPPKLKQHALANAEKIISHDQKNEEIKSKNAVIEHPGGKMIVELVAAWNNLTERLSSISSKSSELLLKALKVSLPLLQALPPAADGRSQLSKAISVACILADLQVSAEVIVVGLLKEAYDTGAICRREIIHQFGYEVAHLLHESLRVKRLPRRLDVLDEDNAHALRKYCLAHHDIQALIVELASQLDLMRHSANHPKYYQQTAALDILQVYAPLAHAIGAGQLSLELEDLAFQSLFPRSYSSVDAWLSSYENHGKAILERYKDQIYNALKKDYELSNIVDQISIKARYKSRFSTMKKLMKDGRKLEEVYDVLGMRIILNPCPGDGQREREIRACYRAYELIRQMYEEAPQRMKDYIAKPKENGYQSLHLAIKINDEFIRCPVLEIQIRTTEMDAIAVGGAASHALYKGEVTNPEEVRQLKEIMMAAANLAAFHFHDVPRGESSTIYNEMRIQMFKLFDKDEDGFISMEELKDMMGELGANKDDANELMQLVDANSDGFLSAEEFSDFQKRVKFFQNVSDMDKECNREIGEKFEKLHT
eukprot:TRINITY_DN7865_c0_g1_i1.p1 TRINITY_DN7865_c0_g1~~TRINITY_DN7865_c0_g1_i1.p1  ORF type:complete len:569 (-),score=126.85 TRINITY_DN7865_c0_g1_i1:548-2254(-)